MCLDLVFYEVRTKTCCVLIYVYFRWQGDMGRELGYWREMVMGVGGGGA